MSNIWSLVLKIYPVLIIAHFLNNILIKFEQIFAAFYLVIAILIEFISLSSSTVVDKYTFSAWWTVGDFHLDS